MKYGYPKLIKCFVITIFLCSLFLTSGCKLFPGFKKYISSDINVAGALTHSPNSFSPTDAGTIKLQSEEIWYRKDFSGNKTTFLWGLFTFTDY
jgi:hypothetical protein